MNKVVLIGRLAKDPELRRTSTDIPVVQFSLAVNRNFSRNGERTADFIPCVAWRNLAENLAKFMRKGSQIAVEGQIQIRTYEDTNGMKRYATVICDNIHFLESKSSRESVGFSDINSYDIPDFQGSNQQFNDSPFKGNNNDERLSNDIEDPFANLKTKTGVSDDDLPF